MSIILLSLLLVILVGLGGLMARKTAMEYFENPPSPLEQKVVVDVSPALANLLDTPRLVAEMNGAAPAQVDALAREKEAVVAANKPAVGDKPHKCPKCPKCPDMSKYVRLDEVPCWNCTLP
jgi:hypothetical protein